MGHADRSAFELAGFRAERLWLYLFASSNRGRGNMHMRVTAEQFVLQGDKLTHTPTGATFWLGDKDVVCCERGHLSLETGDDYKLDELKDEAWRIMALERKAGT